MSDEERQNESANDSRSLTIPLEPPMLIAIGIAAAGLLLMCFLGTMLIREGNGLFGGGRDEDGTPEATQPAEGEEDPLAQGENAIILFDGINTLSVDLDPPTSIMISGNPFTVTTQLVSQDGAWLPSSSDDEVEWVYGTIVNYVIGLPDNAVNEALLESLSPGDRLQLTTRNDDSREFVVTGRELSTASNEELFAQNRPQITLIWLGEKGNSQRLVVFGDFVLPEAQADSGVQGRASVEIGEVAQLAEVSVTALQTSQVVNSPSTPPGFMVFLIDFELQNVGGQALDTGLLRFVLLDEAGNQYPLNTAASQEGNFPILTGNIESGTGREASAGYQIPANLQSGNLRWVISRVDMGGQIDVSLPFTSGSSQNIEVSLQQANVSSDGTSLLLSGQVTNLSDQPLSITESDLALEGGGSIYLVFSTNPGFPWTIDPGQPLPFAVTFQRPATPSAVFTLKNRSFELSGLR